MPDSASNELLWFLCGLVFLLSEFFIPGFVIFFFGVGAWIVALMLWLNVDISFTTQIFVFLISSVLSLVLFRRYGKKYYQAKVTRDDAQKFDDIRGEKAVVTSTIVPNGIDGKVEFHGTVWNAESDVAVPKGTVVEIVERNNLTLKVKPLP